MTMKQVNKTYLIIFGLLIAGFIYLLAPILTPFLVGALLAYLTDPLVNILVRLRVPRVYGAVIVFVALFTTLIVFILFMIPLIEHQISTLIQFIPKFITWLQQTVIPLLSEYFGVDEQVLSADALKSMVVENWSKAGHAADVILKATLFSGVKVLEWLVNLVLIPVVTFYLLCDWDKLLKGCRNLLPRKIEPTVVRLTKECDSVLSAFFRGQLLVMLALSIFYSAGLTLVGLQIGLLIGVISGLLSIVPYLGFIIGIVIASIAAFVQTGEWMSVLLVGSVYVVGHLGEHMLLTPKLVGNRIGLHPVAVIFAILAGGLLGGFFGVLLALPVASVIMVWVRYLYNHYRKSQLYQSV